MKTFTRKCICHESVRPMHRTGELTGALSSCHEGVGVFYYRA